MSNNSKKFTVAVDDAGKRILVLGPEDLKNNMKSEMSSGAGQPTATTLEILKREVRKAKTNEREYLSKEVVPFDDSYIRDRQREKEEWLKGNRPKKKLNSDQVSGVGL